MVENKIKKSKANMLNIMIKIFCRGHHGNKKELCSRCAELQEYALKRLEMCPHANDNTFCSSCTIKCYKNEMKEEMRNVMKYSGPRIILYHPILAIRHLIKK